MKMRIRNLEKNFGNIKAVSNIDLDFETGHIYGLLGRNGAGKTTLLNLVTDRLRPDSGIVSIDGINVINNDKALSKIFLATEGNLFGTDSVKSIFEYAAVFDPNFDSDYALTLSKLFGLNRKTKVQKLSTGYFTIFKTILALASSAEFIVLDEPTLGLDANHRDLTYKTILERFNTRNSECSFVVSSHLIDEISSIVDKIVIIDDGKILKQDDTETLLDSVRVVLGNKENVNVAVKDIKPIKIENILKDCKAYIRKEDVESITNDNVKIEKIDLQKLFVIMTDNEGVKNE